MSTVTRIIGYKYKFWLRYYELFISRVVSALILDFGLKFSFLITSFFDFLKFGTYIKTGGFVSLLVSHKLDQET